MIAWSKLGRCRRWLRTGRPSSTVPCPRKNFASCANTVARVGRWGVLPSWTVWRGWSAASSGHRKGAGLESYANYHNKYYVPGFPSPDSASPDSETILEKAGHCAGGGKRFLQVSDNRSQPRPRLFPPDGRPPLAMELTKRNNIHSIPGCRRRRVLLAPPYQVIEPAIGGGRCLDKTGTAPSQASICTARGKKWPMLEYRL